MEPSTVISICCAVIACMQALTNWELCRLGLRLQDLIREIRADQDDLREVINLARAIRRDRVRQTSESRQDGV